MNAKKAKALRKIMKNLENENPQVNTATAYSENTLNRKIINVKDLNENGEMVNKEITIATGTISVTKNSHRGLYLSLKNAIKVQDTSKVVTESKRPLV